MGVIGAPGRLRGVNVLGTLEWVGKVGDEEEASCPELGKGWPNPVCLDRWGFPLAKAVQSRIIGFVGLRARAVVARVNADWSDLVGRAGVSPQR